MPESESDLMTLDEVAALLKVSRKTVLNWRARGIGPPGFRVVKAVRFRRSEVARYLAAQEAGEPRGAA